MMTIVLIGFMGAGKSTIGYRLSEVLKKEFIDLDSYIENQEQRTISQIFEIYGEQYFRDLEYKYLNKLIGNEVIIATGGGIVENTNNIKLLERNKLNIWVDTNINTLYNRIVGDSNRPNAACKSIEEIKDLYKKRYSSYNEIAYIKVNSEHSLEECITQIIKSIEANDK